jgi:hypothetical protein
LVLVENFDRLEMEVGSGYCFSEPQVPN